jgi:hypothetical protein
MQRDTSETTSADDADFVPTPEERWLLIIFKTLAKLSTAWTAAAPLLESDDEGNALRLIIRAGLAEGRETIIGDPDIQKYETIWRVSGAYDEMLRQRVAWVLDSAGIANPYLFRRLDSVRLTSAGERFISKLPAMDWVDLDPAGPFVEREQVPSLPPLKVVAAPAASPAEGPGRKIERDPAWDARVAAAMREKKGKKGGAEEVAIDFDTTADEVRKAVDNARKRAPKD